MLSTSCDSCDAFRSHSGGDQFMNPCPRLMQSGGTFAGLYIVSQRSRPRIANSERSRISREDGPHVDLVRSSLLHTSRQRETGVCGYHTGSELSGDKGICTAGEDRSMCFIYSVSSEIYQSSVHARSSSATGVFVVCGMRWIFRMV